MFSFAKQEPLSIYIKARYGVSHNNSVEAEQIQVSTGSFRSLGNELYQQKLAVPLPPLQPRVKCRKWADPHALIFAVVSLADLMIEILTDNMPTFCWVITKDFLDKVNIISKIELSHSGTAETKHRSQHFLIWNSVKYGSVSLCATPEVLLNWHALNENYSKIIELRFLKGQKWLDHHKMTSFINRGRKLFESNWRLLCTQFYACWILLICAWSK